MVVVQDSGLSQQRLVVERAETSVHAAGGRNEVFDSFGIEVASGGVGHDGFVESWSRPVGRETVHLEARQRVVAVCETKECLPCLLHDAGLCTRRTLMDSCDNEVDAFELLGVHAESDRRVERLARTRSKRGGDRSCVRHTSCAKAGSFVESKDHQPAPGHVRERGQRRRETCRQPARRGFDFDGGRVGASCAKAVNQVNQLHGADLSQIGGEFPLISANSSDGGIWPPFQPGNCLEDAQHHRLRRAASCQSCVVVGPAFPHVTCSFSMYRSAVALVRRVKTVSIPRKTFP